MGTKGIIWSRMEKILQWTNYNVKFRLCTDLKKNIINFTRVATSPITASVNLHLRIGTKMQNGHKQCIYNFINIENFHFKKGILICLRKVGAFLDAESNQHAVDLDLNYLITKKTKPTDSLTCRAERGLDVIKKNSENGCKHSLICDPPNQHHSKRDSSQCRAEKLLLEIKAHSSRLEPIEVK